MIKALTIGCRIVSTLAAEIANELRAATLEQLDSIAQNLCSTDETEADAT